MIYNRGFRFTNVYIQLASDFKISNLGNLFGYYKPSLNGIYTAHNGLPVSQINPCPPPPSVVIRSRRPHHPTASSPYCHTAALAACCMGWVCGCGRVALCPRLPPRVLRRRSRSGPRRLAACKRPHFPNLAGKP